MGVVDGLVTVPGNRHTVRSRCEQDTITGPLQNCALRQRAGFGIGLVKTSDLLRRFMTRRARRPSSAYATGAKQKTRCAHRRYESDHAIHNPSLPVVLPVSPS
jgi:hypothetical protein